MKKKEINKKKNTKKKKKGFTLVELLAVIVILAVVMVITIPTVLGSMKKAKEKAFNTAVQAVQKYIDKQVENCKFHNQDLMPYDESIFINNSCELDTSKSGLILELSGYKDSVQDLTIENNGKITSLIGIKDLKGYNFLVLEKPDILNTGLVPIKYNGTSWVATTEDDPDWYDYVNQEWANAASLTESGKSKGIGASLNLDTDVYAMFVWIPRFSYTIGCKGNFTDENGEEKEKDFTSSECLGYKIDGASDLSTSTPGAIDIKFVSKESTKEKYYGYDEEGYSPTYVYTSEDDRIPTNWYTHPAFTFGDQELSGIWVGKFETSISKDSRCYLSYTSNCLIYSDEIRILPNVKSFTNQKLVNQFNYAKYLTDIPGYGLSGDAHIMKNIDWGAVAYLSQSKYGKYGNPNYTAEKKEIYRNDSRNHFTGGSCGGEDKYPYDSDYGLYKYDNISNITNQRKEFSGVGASTTGTIYGIYDMHGGGIESVMFNFNKKLYYQDSGFSEFPDSKYFDLYQSPNNNINEDITNIKNKNTNGGALSEIIGWYNDGSEIKLSEGSPWFARGYYYEKNWQSGIFYSSADTGRTGSLSAFRITLVSP